MFDESLIYNFVFRQENAAIRVALVRITVGIIVVALIGVGGYGEFYARTGHALYQRGWPFRFLGPLKPATFRALRRINIVLAIAFALGLGGTWVAIGFCCTLAVMNFYVTRFRSKYWLPTAYLVGFAIACSPEYARTTLSLDRLLGVPAQAAVAQSWASFALTAMQTYVAVLYLQAGVSKLRVSGIAWCRGQTLLVGTKMHGTEIGRRLIEHALVRTIFSAGAVLFELAFPVAYFAGVSHAALGIAGVMFHLCVYCVMRLSFWFLWGFYPALFIAYS